MFRGMYAVATAINATERNQEVLSLNLSHINTPGYRRQISTFETLVAQSMSGDPNDAQINGAIISGVQHDFSPGAMEQTGRELDVAIDGKGFFVLDTPQGPRYTRNGVFFSGESGELVASNGFPVQGAGGAIRIPPSISPNQILIQADGSIVAGGSRVGKLKVVEFEDKSVLKLDGAAMFSSDVSPTDSDAKLRQGFRERSNVNATHELVNMVVGMRHHEAAQKALRAMSDSLQQHIRP